MTFVGEGAVDTGGPKGVPWLAGHSPGFTKGTYVASIMQTCQLTRFGRETHNIKPSLTTSRQGSVFTRSTDRLTGPAARLAVWAGDVDKQSQSCSLGTRLL